MLAGVLLVGIWVAIVVVIVLLMRLHEKYLILCVPLVLLGIFSTFVLTDLGSGTEMLVEDKGILNKGQGNLVSANRVNSEIQDKGDDLVVKKEKPYIDMTEEEAIIFLRNNADRADFTYISGNYKLEYSNIVLRGYINDDYAILEIGNREREITKEQADKVLSNLDYVLVTN